MKDQPAMEKPGELASHETAAGQRWDQTIAKPCPGGPPTLPRLPGYLSVKEAAHQIGVSTRSVYGYVAAGTLKALRVGSILAVEEESVRGYRRRAPGRERTIVPPWHTPSGTNRLSLLSITVCLRPGQDERLGATLREIRATGQHQLPGTTARYLTRSREHPDQVQLLLIWREAILPPKEEREMALAALRAELADIVRWETALYREGQIILHA